jgi:glycosyltransferase involved in cell wall biosynthesis
LSALSVAIAGASERPTAYASINRIWTDGLRARGIDADLVPNIAALDRAYDVVIHHDYQDPFGELRRPAPERARRFVAVRTWDFGPYPKRWAEVADGECDELWVHSQWVARQAAAGGVDPSRIHVVPHGVDEVVLAPQGPRFDFGPDAPAGRAGRFVFLFVGAAVTRKGVDVLLDAYGKAFTDHEAVTLVIKDHGGDVFYRGVGLGDAIAAFGAREGAPDLVYLDAYLAADDLAALYRSCDAGVFPYRAEGFAMPILEAMACGTPSIVPRFGACLDFCDDGTAFPIAARRIKLPVLRNLQFNTLGFREEVTEVDFCEVDPAVLAAEMRRVAALDRTALATIGAAAAARARDFTWAATIDRIEARLVAGPATRS